jgi:hypothetical protein
MPFHSHTVTWFTCYDTHTLSRDTHAFSLTHRHVIHMLWHSHTVTWYTCYDTHTLSRDTHAIHSHTVTWYVHIHRHVIHMLALTHRQVIHMLCHSHTVTWYVHTNAHKLQSRDTPVMWQSFLLFKNWLQCILILTCNMVCFLIYLVWLQSVSLYS